MLLNSKFLASAMAISVAVMWAICSLFVVLFPQNMTAMTEHMLHLDLPASGLSVSAAGMIMGLIGWMVMAAAFGWLLGVLYNCMLPKPKTSDKASR